MDGPKSFDDITDTAVQKALSGLEEDTIIARSRRRRRVLIRVCAAVLFLVFATAGIVAGKWLHAIGFFDLNDDMLSEITDYKSPDNSVVFDRNGQRLGEFYSSHYIYTPIDKMPKALISAVVSVEDRSFFTHSGIDIKGMIRAAWNLVATGRMSQGASTITQQVVRNFVLTREKTIARKVKEIYLALRLETMIDKKRILEIYLNSLFLGNGSYGVAAAAKRYFGKNLQDLNIAESALIAGLFQSPSRYNPNRFPKRAKKRQAQVIRSMQATHKITKQQAKKIYSYKLAYTSYQSPNTENAPYFVDYVRERAKTLLGKKVNNIGLRIYTSLDSLIQKQAKETIKNSGRLLDRARAYMKRSVASDSKNAAERRVEAALLVTDPHTGHILAMVGGRDYNQSQFNRTTQAKRSPGSAFKPIPYSLALQNGAKWSDMSYVTPINVEDYRPKNYSKSTYLTEATLLKAFYKSINTTIVNIGSELGMDAIIAQAKRLGIRSKLKEEVGTILGASDLTMFDLARMYGLFANGGRVIDPLAILKITDRKGNVLYEAASIEERSEQALSPQIAFLITEGLRSVMNYGTGYNFRRLSDFAVGKSGTSNEAKDNWFCGSSPDLTAVLWAGVDGYVGFEGSHVSAVNLALPIWSAFMNKMRGIREKTEFAQPEKIVSHKVHPNFGSLDNSGITMYFFEGNEPEKESSNFEAITLNSSYRAIFHR